MTVPGFAEQYGPCAVVAGASEGIGASFARMAAAQGLDVVLLARRQQPLDDLAAAIRSEHAVDVLPVAVDLTAPDAGERIAAATAGREVGLLVNNAGARYHHATFVEDPLDVTLRQVQLNCISPVVLCRLFVPGMAARGRGGIVFVGSMAALAGCGGIAAYAAGKAFDNTLAEGLWNELAPHGVHVLSLLAGTTRTPAMERIGLVLDTAEYPAMEPDDVAREGLEHLADGPTWIAGELNRTTVDALRALDRRELVTMMSDASKLVFGLADGA